MSIMKEWKFFDDECNRCGGSDIRVLTDAKEDNYAYDGDDAECLECGLLGCVSIDGDEDDNGNATARISWNDFEEED